MQTPSGCPLSNKAQGTHTTLQKPGQAEALHPDPHGPQACGPPHGLLLAVPSASLLDSLHCSLSARECVSPVFLRGYAVHSHVSTACHQPGWCQGPLLFFLSLLPVP